MKSKSKKLPIVLLTIIFSILKLSGIIDWEWIWVMSPIWLYISVVISIYIIALLIIISCLSFGFTLQEIVEAARKYQEKFSEKIDKK